MASNAVKIKNFVISSLKEFYSRFPWRLGEGTNSIILGKSGEANGDYSVAQGEGTEAKNTSEFAAGSYNTSNTSVNTSGITQFSIGIGTSDSRKNAAEVMKNGDIYILGLGGYTGINPSSSSTLKQVIDSKGTSNFSGNYNDLSNKPTIPAISTNINTDASSDTKTASPKAVKTFVEGKNYITNSTNSLTNYYKKSEVDSLLSDTLDSVPFAEGSGADSAEQWNCMASGDYSIASGYNTTAGGQSSHTEGDSTTTVNVSSSYSGQNAHAEGYRTTAIGANAHIEGRSQYKVATATLSKNDSGIITDWNSQRFSLAKGNSAHVEGYNCLALANYSHAEGAGCISQGQYSHAEGFFTKTTKDNEHAEGKYNLSNTGTISSIGIGTADNSRANAIEVMSDGRVFIYGIGGYTGKNMSSASTLSTVISGMPGSSLTTSEIQTICTF